MTGLLLPQPIATAVTGWQLFDWLDSSFTATAVDGVATIDAGQLDPDKMWLIDHAVIWCGSSTPTTLRLYESFVDVSRLRDGSATGDFDVADWPSGLRVGPLQSLVAQWTGASAGAQATLTLQARVFRRA